MKMLLAGPGTGKTTKIKSIIKEDYPKAKVQVLSFTNATVNDLSDSFKDFENVSVSTLHSYALKINHLPDVHILEGDEIEILQNISNKLEIDFSTLCNLLKCMTFDFMITSSISFIRNNPEYANHNIGKLDLLIVDEYQDFNEVERNLVDLISEFSNETLILGDDDQSIYSFKDADPDGIINLFDSSIEKLSHENICYRCPDEVVNYCNKLIKHNRNRIIKEWKPNNNDGKVYFKQFITQAESNNYICNVINKIKETENDSSILILSPVYFAVQTLISNLKTYGIEFINFWDNKISDETLQKIWILRAIFTENKLLNLIFLSKILNSNSKKKLIKIIKSYINIDLNNEKLIPEILTIKEFQEPLFQLILETPQWDLFITENPKFQEFSDFVDESNLIANINSLKQLMTPKFEFDKSGINIMSIHKSKGLQADYVFILGMVDGIIPLIQKNGLDNIEAQRRLLFVGMSRAMKKLCLLSVVEWDGNIVHKVDKSKFKYDHRIKKYKGKFSSFVEEMNE